MTGEAFQPYELFQLGCPPLMNNAANLAKLNWLGEGVQFVKENEEAIVKKLAEPQPPDTQPVIAVGKITAVHDPGPGPSFLPTYDAVATQGPQFQVTDAVPINRLLGTLEVTPAAVDDTCHLWFDVVKNKVVLDAMTEVAKQVDCEGQEPGVDGIAGAEAAQQAAASASVGRTRQLSFMQAAGYTAQEELDYLLSRA